MIRTPGIPAFVAYQTNSLMTALDHIYVKNEWNHLLTINVKVNIQIKQHLSSNIYTLCYDMIEIFRRKSLHKYATSYILT